MSLTVDNNYLNNLHLSFDFLSSSGDDFIWGGVHCHLKRVGIVNSVVL